MNLESYVRAQSPAATCLTSPLHRTKRSRIFFKGRIEDLQGWALFNQEKYPEAIAHLKQAAEFCRRDAGMA